jgi:hypothetical protein
MRYLNILESYTHIRFQNKYLSMLDLASIHNIFLIQNLHRINITSALMTRLNDLAEATLTNHRQEIKVGNANVLLIIYSFIFLFYYNKWILETIQAILSLI